jgi:UDP-N-acetylmuramoyl-L-alanyl-D-glutamate--2,6-diaminopimelate ligase
MQLHPLIEQSSATPLNALPEATQNSPVVRITANSKQAGPGSIFVALPGTHVDGHDFVAEAIEKGALAVVVEAERQASLNLPSGATVLTCANTYQAFAQLCSAFYGHPGQALTLVGVTGTNGKTTTTHLVEHLLKSADIPTGLIGTLGARGVGQAPKAEGPRGGGSTQKPKTENERSYQSTGHTTPMADHLQATLAKLRDEQMSHVVMEVSSHALAQHRSEGCNFKVAVHTNLTQDHLDYHITMDNYFEAKALLFRGLKPGSHAVINLDDEYGERFVQAVPEGVQLWTYSLKRPEATLLASDLAYSLEGSSFQLKTPQGEVAIQLKLAGEFSVYNTLAAIASGLALGLPLQQVAQTISSAEGVRGRFEVVAREPFVLVDYAHTPDGLENVLEAAKRITPESQRLLVVFGCGGDRDASKRPQMGRLAEQLADALVVTSDNPRTEDPQQILADVLAGIEQFDPQRMKVIADRREAIQQALDWAEAKDVVLVAGKGHEDYQILADRVIHFDDREEVQTYLAERPKTQAKTQANPQAKAVGC